ncbi:hypothetical protein B0T16DRAFT_451258 [Cercophora newfieldiana]|uniref:Uncharacterized protein n=1 Tax=Cercophora newfieldiana TaxID=92897 RepID=A0AA39YN54_9PEZI|nr:hypothetical protein B0T16DRAFT_451258 [Cercophora newfieldiana]
MSSPGYTDEVAEECHDLIDRAEEEAHTGMHENDPISSSKSKMKSTKGGLESKTSDTSSSMSSKAEGMKESMGKKMDSMKDTMGMNK